MEAIKGMEGKEEARKPIVYEGDIHVRFGDLDPYGHLNSKHYMDFVSSARLDFMARVLKCPIETVTERGYAIYIRRAEQVFRRPVVGLVTVHQRSHISSVKGATLEVKYELLDRESGKVYSDGTLDYIVFDLKTQRPARPPEWMYELFYE